MDKIKPYKFEMQYKNVRRIVALVLCFFVSVLSGCWNEKKASDAVADQSYLYGMCYIAYESAAWNGVDYTLALETMNNMGVKSWRNWMHFDWVMSAPDVVKKDGYTLMRAILDEASKYGFQVIGMCHKNFATINDISGFHVKKPYLRNLAEGSAYREWLSDYETSWYTLAGLFPDVLLWEVDNEPTNDGYMSLIDGTILSIKQKAEILADMLFYASRGIKRANPQAQVIVGGLDQVDSGVAADFTKQLYDVIEDGSAGSTNPDDFFDCYGVHTYYTGFKASTYKSDLNEIYDIVKQRDKPKKFYITEAGWTEANTPSATAASYVTEMYAVATQMPYVESIHYFRLLDDTRDGEWSTGLNELVAGMFYDPDPTMSDMLDGQRRKPGAPKPTAYAYQTSAGGSGDLTLMEKEI